MRQVVVDYLNKVHPAVPAAMLVLVVAALFAWMFQVTGFGINPTEKDIAPGVKFVETQDGGRYLVQFTEPLLSISFRGKSIREIRSHPRVLWVDTVEGWNDPRALKLASEMGKKPHGI